MKKLVATVLASAMLLAAFPLDVSASDYVPIAPSSWTVACSDGGSGRGGGGGIVTPSTDGQPIRW